MTRLAEKVALVTGARQGIGSAIVQRMRAEGAAVIAADIRPGDSSDAHAVVLDVTQEAQWAVLAANICRDFGKLDILVNNAGIDVACAAAETSLADWRRVMAVNLDGVFLGCTTMHALLVEAAKASTAGSSIVNMSSSVGIGAMPGRVAYGTSKAGVRHLSKLLAVEWGASRIRVNSIHPGTIRTAMFEESIRDWAQANTSDGSLESGIAIVAGTNPLQRIGSVEDIAQAAVYLASDEAGYVTGTELIVDGGILAS